MIEATKSQMRAKFNFLYQFDKWYGRMESAGLITFYGLSVAARDHRTFARLDRAGIETSWGSVYGINADMPGLSSYWVEVSLRTGGDPYNPADWLPTGEAWPVGSLPGPPSRDVAAAATA